MSTPNLGSTTVRLLLPHCTVVAFNLIHKQRLQGSRITIFPRPKSVGSAGGQRRPTELFSSAAHCSKCSPLCQLEFVSETQTEDFEIPSCSNAAGFNSFPEKPAVFFSVLEISKRTFSRMRIVTYRIESYRIEKSLARPKHFL